MKKIGKIGVLVVLGILVLVTFSVSLMAQSWGTTVTENASYRISIDDDNNAGDEVFAVWEGVGGGGGSELFRVQEDGNVGIGTTGPSHKLEIADASTTANRAGLYVAQSGAISGTGYGSYVSKTGASTTNVGGYFSASGATNNYGLIVENGYVGIGTTSPNAELDVIGDADIYGYLTADNGHFYVDDTNHRVAIGTSTPARKLDIYDDTDTPQLRLSYGSSVYVDFLLNAGGDLVMTPTSGFVGIGAAPNSPLHVEFDNAQADTDLVTFARTSASPADDDSYNIDFRHEDDNDELDIFAQIKLIALDVSDGTEAGELAFSVADGVDGSVDEAMRIIAGGNVGIGTTTPLAKLHVEGIGKFNSNSNNAFLIGNGATSYMKVDTVNNYIGFLTSLSANNQVHFGKTVVIDTTGYADDAWGLNISNYDAQTTDNTPTTIATLGTRDDTVMALTVTATGIKNGGSQVAHYVRHVTYKNVAGTLSTVGSVSSAHTVEQDTAWDVTFTTSSTDIIIQVTGNMSDSINWQVTVEENIVHD